MCVSCLIRLIGLKELKGCMYSTWVCFMELVSYFVYSFYHAVAITIKSDSLYLWNSVTKVLLFFTLNVGVLLLQ